MKRTVNLLFLFYILFSGGCLEIEQEFFLNPDSSGKFICRLNVSVPTNIDSAAQKYGISAEKLMVGKIEAELNRCKGIELWRDGTYQFSEDKKVFHYNRVAYFRNLNDCFLSIPELSINPQYAFYKNADGQVEIAFGTIAVDSPIKPLELSAKQKAQAMIEARIVYAKSRLGMPGYFGAIKLRNVFHLPANIREYSNFEKTSNNSARLSIDGKKVLAAMDSAVNDDSWLSERVKYSTNVFAVGWDYAMNKEIFGSKAAARLLLYPSSMPLFDYETEILPVSETPELVEQDADSIDEATDYYRLPRGIANYKTPVNVQLRRAVRFAVDGDFEAAIQRYMNILANGKASDKYLARTYYQLGMCLFDNGFSQQAIEQLNYVIDKFSLQTATALKASEQVHFIYSGKAVAKNAAEAEENPAPLIVSAEPKQFSEGVSADTQKIVLRFDRPIGKYHWYYSSFKGCVFPESVGEPFFDETMQIWTLPVKLQAGRTYAISINNPEAMGLGEQRGFVSAEGVAVAPFVLVFTTADKKGNPTFIKDEIFDRVDSFLKNSSH
ncbi:MAG: hypothetical protein K8R02_08955 [Anaerohalosphaeraceae bacterium]|nr:hypothetical protein [Anaerohalosphaeraceae bacterium]